MTSASFNIRDDFRTAVAIGAVAGVLSLSDFASASGLAAATPVILGTSSAVLLLPPDAGEVIELYSADAGNGGAIIHLEVLDELFDTVIVIVNVPAAAGAVLPVIHPTTGLAFKVTRVNGAVNRGPRGAGEMVGDITVRSTATPANVFGTITGGSQELQQAIRTVPRGRRLIINALSVSMRKSTGSGTDVAFVLNVAPVGEVFRQTLTFGLQRSGDSAIVFDRTAAPARTGPVDLYLTAEASAGPTDVSALLTVTLVTA
jgi:hypothetical protein